MLRAGVAAVGLATAFTVTAGPFRAEPRKEQSDEVLVFVTGSLIPQRVKLRSIGTPTTSPLRVIDRREIDQTGRQTTAGAFMNDPSIRIIGR
jgi:hypothetical protein